MKIIVSDVKRFGLCPTMKRFDLANIYLVTANDGAGEPVNPAIADEAVMLCEPKACIAEALSKRGRVLSLLNARTTTTWLLDVESNIENGTVEWVPVLGQHRVDYNSERLIALQEELTQVAPWMFVGKENDARAITEALLGMAHLSLSTFMRPTDLESERLDKKAPAYSFLNMVSGVVELLRGGEIKYSIKDNVCEALEKEYALLGEGGRTEDGLIVNKLKQVPVKAKSRRDPEDVIIAHPNYLRKVVKDKGRYQTAMRQTRVKDVKGEWVYFSYSNLLTCSAIAEVLTGLHQALADTDNSLSIKDRVLNKSIDLEDLYHWLSDLEAEAMTVSGCFETINLVDCQDDIKALSACRDEVNGISLFTSEIKSILPQDQARRTHILTRHYGLGLLLPYFQHPLKRNVCFAYNEPHHLQWMQWCDKVEPEFVQQI